MTTLAQRYAVTNMRTAKKMWGELGKPSPIDTAVSQLQSHATYTPLGNIGRCEVAEVNGETVLYNRYVGSTHRRYAQTFATIADAFIEAGRLAAAASA